MKLLIEIKSMPIQKDSPPNTWKPLKQLSECDIIFDWNTKAGFLSVPSGPFPFIHVSSVIDIQSMCC